MRMRVLKPGFFTNDQLAEVSPLGRLLFQGLWCLADREGRLEDRPKRIKAEILPYDNCNVDRLLTDLADRGFIERYTADDQPIIQVINFERHQRPHYKEEPSTLPPSPNHRPMIDPASIDSDTQELKQEQNRTEHKQIQEQEQGETARKNGAAHGRGNPRVQALVEAFRTRHIEPMFGPRDYSAIKNSTAPPGLIAEVYSAVSVRTYGDEFMRRRLSVHEAIDWVSGYVEHCLEEAWQKGESALEAEKQRLKTLGWLEPVEAIA